MSGRGKAQTKGGAETKPAESKPSKPECEGPQPGAKMDKECFDKSKGGRKK